MMEYKDYNGIPVNVGDFVLVADNRSFGKAIVIGYTPTKVRTSSGTYNPECCVVASELFAMAGKTQWMAELKTKYADKLNSTIEKPKVSWRYLAAVVYDATTKQKFGVVLKVDATTQDRFRESRREMFKVNGYSDDAYFLQRCYKGVTQADGTKYKEEFDKGYSYYLKGYSLAAIRAWGMENLIGQPMPLDQFILSFPKFNLSGLQSAGKI